MSAWNDEPEPASAGGVAGDFRSERARLESPMTWSLPLCRLGSVSVRVHALFLLLIAVELLRSSVSAGGRTLALPPTAMILASFFALSLLHELARTLCYRRVGGDLDEWLLWPLGGLCAADAGDREGGSAWCAASGWLAQALLAAVVGAVLYYQTGRVLNGAVPLPWSLEGYRELSLTGAGTGIECLWLLQWSLMVTLALGALPAFPLTGGQVLLALLAERRGWSATAHLVARAGVVCAVALLVAGLAFDGWTMSALALLVWIASRETVVRVEATDALMQERPERIAPQRRAPSDDQAEIDRILEKINRDGMKSLSMRERWRLKAATRRRRDGGGGIR